VSMRGSVTELMKKRGYGRILGEDGCLLYFDEKSLDGVGIRALSVGDWVEYQEQDWGGPPPSHQGQAYWRRGIGVASRP